MFGPFSNDITTAYAKVKPSGELADRNAEHLRTFREMSKAAKAEGATPKVTMPEVSRPGLVSRAVSLLFQQPNLRQTT